MQASLTSLYTKEALPILSKPLARHSDLLHVFKLKPMLVILYSLIVGLPALAQPDIVYLNESKEKGDF